MNVYVLGAGVSKTVGYPLGVGLFDEIDSYVRGSSPCFNRFDYAKDWGALKRWLGMHKNPVVAEAYRSRQFEHLFTIFDLAWRLRLDSLGSVLRSAKSGKRAVASAERAWRALKTTTDSYQKYRQILLWALENFLGYMHEKDAKNFLGRDWNTLRALGRKLCPGDVVLTFNYDSTLERVLWEQEKWSPADGYGFDLVFQKSGRDSSVVSLPKSKVKIIHLHGSVGWYNKPALREDYPFASGGGAIPREALTPAPIETPIALDPLFLRDLGIPAVDASLPKRPSSERQVFLHPSFLKDYELEGENRLFIRLWRLGAECLRSADEIAIVGYSLPDADSAALTLLLTSCGEAHMDVVNRNRETSFRLQRLFSANSKSHWVASPAISIEDWLPTVADC